jgi:hypothetical protein
LVESAQGVQGAEAAGRGVLGLRLVELVGAHRRECDVRVGCASCQPSLRLLDRDRRRVDAEPAAAVALGEGDQQLAGAAADVEDTVVSAEAQPVERLDDAVRIERVVEGPVAVRDRGDAVAIHQPEGSLSSTKIAWLSVSPMFSPACS